MMILRLPTTIPSYTRHCLVVWIALVGCGDDRGTSGSDSASTSAGATETAAATTTAGSMTATAAGSMTATADGSMTVTGSMTAATGGSTSGTSMSSTSETTGPLLCEPACEGGFTCVDGECCDPIQVCGEICCDNGQVCSFGACIAPGADCTESSECAKDEYCDFAFGDPLPVPETGCAGGTIDKQGKCLPTPPECAPDEVPDPQEGITCIPTCEYIPEAGLFEIELKHHFDGLQSISPPIVVQLDDDDCDGRVTENDIPEILVAHFIPYGAGPGSLYAFSVINGELQQKWVVEDALAPVANLAAGDLDGDGVAEIVTCAAPSGNGPFNTGVIAFKADGSELWTQNDTTRVHCGRDSPAIADPLQTGKPMILVGWTLLDGATGEIVEELDPAMGPGVYINGFADVDADGFLDVLTGQKAFSVDGVKLWDLSAGEDAIPAGYHGIADFDLDGLPEIVVVSPSLPFAEPVSGAPHTISLYRPDPNKASGVEVLRKEIDLNTLEPPSSPFGGGPPTIADFDGDGIPDVGTATSSAYVVLSGAKLLDPDVADPDVFLWSRKTRDKSSAATGSTVFDFHGDGSAEVLYSDEFNFWIYAGKDGSELLPETCNTTGTLWEYPVVADVDNDGEADILVVSNDYFKESHGIVCPGDETVRGLRIFGSPKRSWVRTRRVWNQHTYHVTNINEDGTVPVVEAPNWNEPDLNSYRQNKQPDSVFAAPDAIVELLYPECIDDFKLVASVRNLGSAVLPAGATVTFYKGPSPDGIEIAQALTKISLYPGQAELVALDLGEMHPDIKAGDVSVYAVVESQASECRTDNNSSTDQSGTCITPE